MNISVLAHNGQKSDDFYKKSMHLFWLDFYVSSISDGEMDSSRSKNQCF